MNSNRLTRILLATALGGSLASCDGENTGGHVNGDGPGGNSPLAGVGGATGPVAARCSNCGMSECPTEAKDCNELPVCSRLIDCTVSCNAEDAACKNDCATAAASDNGAIVAAADYLACITVQCTSECFSPVGIGGNSNIDPSAGGSGSASAAGGSRATGGSVATGGTSTVTYRCEGMNTVTSCSKCGGTNPSCNCNNIPGCSGNVTYTCSGTPTLDCVQFDSFSECESAGCAVDYSESSSDICMTPSCSSLSNSSQCAMLPGCKISNSSVSCTGSPTPCSGLSGQRCSDTAGCKLVPVQQQA